MFLKSLSQTKIILYVLIFSLFVIYKSSASEKTKWHEKEGVFEISFKQLKFVVDANLAGRIISFQLDGKEILGQADLHPEMFGSTFWPAPQSDWKWPPYPTLDIEPYSKTLIGDTLILESKTCPISGLKFFKKFVPQPNFERIKIEYIILNNSGIKIKVAPWEVTRTPSFGLTFFPQSNSAPLEKSTLKNVEFDKGIIWYYSNTESFSGGQKMFVSGSEGWLAHCHKNMLFIKQFPDIKEGECASGQGEIEVYANGNYNYIELENHGKIESLKPGEKIIYPVFWYLKEIPDEIQIESKNSALVEEARKTVQQIRVEEF